MAHVPDIDDQEFWSSIFENIEMNFIPFEYVSLVTVLFENGSHRILELPNEVKQNGIVYFSQFLNQLSFRYRKNITDVKFRLDIDRLKYDIIQHTREFI